MSKPLSICRIGGLHFEPSGKLTHYQDKNGIKRWVKVDVPRKARGPAYLGSANKKDNEDMRRNGWEPLRPLTRETRMVLLSGAEKRENFANEDVLEDFKYIPELGFRELAVRPKKHRPLYHKRVGDPNRLAWLDAVK